MQSVVDRNVVMRRITVFLSFLLLLLLIFQLLLLYLSPLCSVFTITYLQQTVVVGYIVLQLFCMYTLRYK